MHNDASSTELLGTAISCTGSEQFEPAFLAWLQSCLSFDGMTAIAYFQNAKPQPLFVWSSSEITHSFLHSIYLAGAYQIDPIYELHVRQYPRGCYRLRDIAPDQFHRTQYYEEYFRFTGLTDEIGILTYPADDVSLVISLECSKASGRRFSRHALKAAENVFPVAAALADRHWSTLEPLASGKKQMLDAALIASLREMHGISLSPRQAQVALLVLKGHSSVSIGLHLGISPQTVKVFRKQIYKRCKISSQAELFSLLLPLLSI